ncbi:single-stranded DNA-binding protein [Novosphingobium sp. HII-3]|uniref:single-stranded DNA-binding protein n=1 Tax=Novosphingobium sp. HII-3 TaxID=2075565 RepID=UPI000CDA9520|nr:single-stranded DNA-binding protein [Novosphingobium sp. HII-3]
MKQITIAGNTGRDAEYKQARDGSEMCSFTVAVEDGWGQDKGTLWFDVTRWGKGAQGLAKALGKGSKVAVTGDLTTREHNGKTYLQIRADKVSIMSTPNTGQRRDPDGSRGAPEPVGSNGGFGEDLDDDIPFATDRSIW